MRILVTGGEGQLGREVTRVFEAPGHHEVISCGRDVLDLASRDSVLQVITTVEPDAVVHAGAWTAVDACEAEPDRAFRVNALGTRWVVEGVRIVGGIGCYVSTDYVFDGTADRPYVEWDRPNPISAYGRSKYGGELELEPNWSCVRTSWVCGAHGRNFVKTMLALAADRDEIGVVSDQHGSPSFATDIAAAIYRIVVARLTSVFHVSNQGSTTWFEFGRAVLEEAGIDPAKIVPITTEAYGAVAPRPAYAVLDNAALRLADMPLLPHWRDSLASLVKELTTA